MAQQEDKAALILNASLALAAEDRAEVDALTQKLTDAVKGQEFPGHVVVAALFQLLDKAVDSIQKRLPAHGALMAQMPRLVQ